MNEPWKRREVIGDCTLYLGDCFDVMLEMNAKSIDHIITDPPYEKEAHRKDRRVTKRSGIVQDALDFDQISEDQRLASCVHAESICSGWFIAFCQAEGVALWRDAIETAGIKYKSPMIWVKPDGMPQFNGQGPGMGYESMVSAWCGKGYSRWNGGGRHGVFTIPKGDPERTGHKTQKPIKLMEMLVSLFSNHSDVILDPFMGSGTTGAACVRLGRRFVGIEMNQKYFDVSCRRIKEAYKQPDMFVNQPSKPVQENMF